MPMTVLDPGTRTLDEIADSIRSHWAATEEDRFAIGHLLAEARKHFEGDREYGQWVATLGLPVGQQTTRLWRLAAENEEAVRNVLVTQVTGGKTPNLNAAVRAVLEPEEDDEYPEPARTDVDISPEYRALMRAMKEFLDLRSTVNTVRMNWTPDQKRLLQERSEAVVRLAKYIHNPQAGRITLEVHELP